MTCFSSRNRFIPNISFKSNLQALTSVHSSTTRGRIECKFIYLRCCYAASSILLYLQQVNRPRLSKAYKYFCGGMRISSFLIIAITLTTALPVAFYCSPYCSYSGQSPLCNSSEDNDCTGCDNVTFFTPPGGAASYQCQLGIGYTVAGGFK